MQLITMARISNILTEYIEFDFFSIEFTYRAMKDFDYLL